MRMISAKSATLLLLSSALYAEASMQEKKTDDFVNFISKTSSMTASVLQRRKIQECLPLTMRFSSLDKKIIKEIEDVFNPTPWTFENFVGPIEDDAGDFNTVPQADSFTLDFEKMPSFLDHYEDKCNAQNGEVYSMVLGCDVLGNMMLINKFPFCVASCPDHYTDDIASVLNEGFEPPSGAACVIEFEKGIGSAAPTKEVSFFISALLATLFVLIAI